MQWVILKLKESTHLWAESNDLTRWKKTELCTFPHVSGSDMIVCVCVCRHMPGHTSREILVIFSSLTTCDPANIYELIQV